MKKRLLTMILTLITAFTFSVTAYAGPAGGGAPPVGNPIRTIITLPDMDK